MGRMQRGRPRQGRPPEAVQQTPAVPLLSNGSQGAQPACKITAPKGQSPPANAQLKEQGNAHNVSPGGSYVNGKANAFPYSYGDGGIVWHKSADTHTRIANF